MRGLQIKRLIGGSRLRVNPNADRSLIQVRGIPDRREGVGYTTVPWGAGESSCGIWIMQGSVTEN